MSEVNAPERARAPGLAKVMEPSVAYKRRVWAAVAALLVFATFYVLLAAWFLQTAYALTIGAVRATPSGWIIGLAALVLAVFMLKAIFFLKRGQPPDGVEVTAADQPRLFEFLHEIAAEAGAPRPHRVFITSRVNAAVFYDLSLLNLVVPSRKNLEIGLGLVNALGRGELRAVLAHEFGHFAQRSMAVGRWVYITQQVSAHLVARRDKLDDLLIYISRIDFRIAWFGWILRIIVWSIRSLVESAFRVLLLLHRALSRQMEFQADLVAVSLTGSDALIHALHKLQAADDSWSRAAAHADRELGRGRAPADLFALQSLALSRMRDIFADPTYGAVPPLPAVKPEAHRVFTPETAQPPRMWLTHPPNHEREANAKRDYLARPIDDASSWTLFEDPAGLRARVTAELVKGTKATPAPAEDSLRALEAEFERPPVHRRYRGLYMGRSVVRGATTPEELSGPVPADWRGALDALYPESLVGDVARLRDIGNELAQLRAIESGAAVPTDGVIRHRGDAIARPKLAAAIGAVQAEMQAVEMRLRAADRDARAAHIAAARALGGGWDGYLQGVLAVLHYAEHTEACILDLNADLAATTMKETVTGRVSNEGRVRVVRTAMRLHDALASASRRGKGIELDARLLKRLEVERWEKALETYVLAPPAESNLGDWLGVIGGWVQVTTSAHSRLAEAALDELLSTESAVAEAARSGTTTEPAPAPSAINTRYETLLPEALKERTVKLDLWERFVVAAGPGPAAARFVAAAAIVIAVLGFGGAVGTARLAIQNGLDRAVVVRIDGEPILLEPLTTFVQDVELGSHIVRSFTVEREMIDSIDVRVAGRFATYAFNVAGAAPLVEWSAVYGNAKARPERQLGAPTWARSDAETIFEDPPAQMSVSRSGGAQVRVLTGLASERPERQLGMLEDTAYGRVAAAHVRWDRTSSSAFGFWMGVLGRFNTEHRSILAQRLAQAPNDVVLLRAEQDGVEGADHDLVCQRHRERAAAAPDDPDLVYVVARCEREEAQGKAWLAGHARWPDHPWLANAAAYTHAERGEWDEAIDLWERSMLALPGLTEAIATDVARVVRLRGEQAPAHPGIRRPASARRERDLASLAKRSPEVARAIEFERGSLADTTGSDLAYLALQSGDLPKVMREVRGVEGLEAGLTRYVAASEGADSAQVALAFALKPDDGIDLGSYVVSVALGLREGHPASVPGIERFGSLTQMGRVLNFLRHAQRREIAAAERELNGLPPQLRGQAYSGGVVILGSGAPAEWRRGAKRLLFTWERPYFR